MKIQKYCLTPQGKAVRQKGKDVTVRLGEASVAVRQGVLYIYRVKV